MNDQVKKPSRARSPTEHAFGRHVRSCRKARGLTQEALAERSALSADTIRRIESGSFSPSHETLRKLCRGLGMRLSTLFEGFETADRDVAREIVDLTWNLDQKLLDLLLRLLHTIIPELQAAASESEPD